MAVRCRVVSLDIDIISLDDTLLEVERLARLNKGTYVCVSNVHMCIEAYDSSEFCELVNNANLVIPDGKPLSWSQKLLGHNSATQVRGQDIMNAICAASGEKSLNVGFYGGSSDVLLEQVATNLKASFPDINITFAHAPPFKPLTLEEDNAVVHAINEAKVDVLFVGIGCPKQEYWMASHQDSLNCVMLGVGAAFDFIAGTKKHAPRWMQRLGLEWFFRLCSEPNRLWRRYFSTNPRFIWYFMRQYIKHKVDAK